jgi:hypothetical protein
MVGTAVIAVLGYANWNIIEEAKAKAEKSATAAVAGAIVNATKKIGELAVDVAVQTKLIEAERARASELQGLMAEELLKLSLEAKNLTALNESVAEAVDARSLLKKDIIDIKVRTETVSVLIAQLTSMAEKLGKSDQPNAQAYNDVVSKLDTAQKKAEALAKRPTVYLQFAGGARSRAKELLAKLLDTDRFVLPGEERHGGAAGKREVRYYDAADLDGAKALADATLKALIDMKYSGDQQVKIIDLTGYNGLKPKQGILELWVEL